MGGILLWIVLISAAVGTNCTALTSSGTGRLWHVDTLELRRHQRFKHVLSLHVDAVRLSRPAARRRHGQGRSSSPSSPLVRVRSRSESSMSRVGHPAHQTVRAEHLAGSRHHALNDCTSEVSPALTSAAPRRWRWHGFRNIPGIRGRPASPVMQALGPRRWSAKRLVVGGDIASRAVARRA